MQITWNKRGLLIRQALGTLETLMLSIYVFFCVLHHQFEFPIAATLMFLIPTSTLLSLTLAVIYFEKVRFADKVLRTGVAAAESVEVPRAGLFLKICWFGALVVGLQAYAIVYFAARHDYLVGTCLAAASVFMLVAMVPILRKHTIMSQSFKQWALEYAAVIGYSNRVESRDLS